VPDSIAAVEAWLETSDATSFKAASKLRTNQKRPRSTKSKAVKRPNKTQLKRYCEAKHLQVSGNQTELLKRAANPQPGDHKKKAKDKTSNKSAEEKRVAALRVQDAEAVLRLNHKTIKGLTGEQKKQGAIVVVKLLLHQGQLTVPPTTVSRVDCQRKVADLERRVEGQKDKSRAEVQELPAGSSDDDEPYDDDDLQGQLDDAH